MMFIHRQYQMIVAIRVLLSATFFLSALGKLFDHSTSAAIFRQLFGLPEVFAENAAMIWAFIEIGLSALMWRCRLPRAVLFIPIMFFGVTVASYLKGMSCSCFGSLPILSQFPFESHLFLLGGMFCGLYYLSAKPEIVQQAKTAVIIFNKWPLLVHAIGLAAIFLMITSFLVLPFSAPTRPPNDYTHERTVDRPAVEAVIANHNAVLIDARPNFQFELGHLPGAINIPYNATNLIELLEAHALKHHTLIVYCSSVHCNAAGLLAERLRGLGCASVKVYPGGWEEWEGSK